MSAPSTARRRAWRPRLRPRLRVIRATSVAVLVVLALSVAALCMGDRFTPPTLLWDALLGVGEENVVYAVREVRMPRVVLALAVGASFGVAGGLSQSVLRNPLASPDVLGVAAGASAAAVAVIAIGSFGGGIGILPIPVAALLGGLGAAALIALLARESELRGRRILLVGIALSMAFTGATQFLLTRMDIYDAQRAAVWLTGSLNARGFDHAMPVLGALAVLLPAALVLAHANRALLFDDDIATGWGAHPRRTRVLLLLIAVALASVATSAAGPVAFVALVAGQLARRIAGVADIPPVLAGLVGAAIVLAADTVTRTLLPLPLPVGVLTGLVGAPYLLYLLQRRRHPKGTIR